MRYTEELRLPIYDNPNSDLFKIQDWNEANQNIENKIKEHSEKINNTVYQAKYFGITNDENTSQKIQELIDFIPDGSKIQFENIVYTLKTDIDFKGKNIEIITQPKTEFIGKGMFPQLATNGYHRKDGTFISKSPSIGKTNHPTVPYGNFGDSALSLEMLPQQGYVGNAVGLFACTKSNNTVPNHEAWGANIMCTVNGEYTGNAWGLEIDASCWSPYGKMIGCDIVTPGKYRGFIGCRVTGVEQSEGTEYDTYRWDYGFLADKSNYGMVLQDNGHGLLLTRNSQGIIVEQQNEGHLILKTNKDGYGKVISVKDNTNTENFFVQGNGHTVLQSLNAKNYIQFPSSTTTVTRITKKLWKRHKNSGTTTVPANGTYSTEITFNGCAIGDFIGICPSFASPVGISYTAYVLRANTVVLRINNCTNQQVSFDGLQLEMTCETFVNV